jgi:two-component system, OmpR family, heavy metal sensor histidine kinase CusS
LNWNVPVRARLTALYFAVLTASFLGFFWISDIGFQRSIEITVNNASLGNLHSVETVLAKSVPGGSQKVRDELEELRDLWANGALFEVADARGNWIFRSPRFLKAYPTLPQNVGASVSFFTTNLDLLQYRIALQRVEAAGQNFEIHAAAPTEPFDQALDRFRLIEKEALPMVVLLASVFGYWLSGRSLAPVNRIIATAERIGVENLSRRLEVPKARDELRRLTETLNAMLGRIEASFKRITQFTADASHDLRTPVTVMRSTAEITLRRSRSEEEYREALSTILETSVETSALLENLLTLARADAGVVGMEMHPLELGASVRKAQQRALALSADKPLEVAVLTPAEPVWVKADAIAIDRLLLILMDNAVKYTPPGGRCEIALKQVGDQANITVRDTGIGIAEKDLEAIFDRFYRADRARSRDIRGTGLGLAIARRITEMHGGTLAAKSQPGAGATFQVCLPAPLSV